MKLAIVRRKYSPFGGAERVIARLVPLLSRHGVETTLISEAWDTGTSDAHRIIKVGQGGWTRNGQAKFFRARVENFLKTEAKTNRKFNLIQTHERLLGANIFRAGDGVHRAWLRRLEQETSVFQSLLYRIDPFHRSLIEIEHAMAAEPKLHYVANSMLVAHELQEFLAITPNRISVVPNMVDTANFAPASALGKSLLRGDLSKKLGLDLSDESKIVCFVGSGFRRKGVEVLIRAIAKCRGLYGLICGYDRHFKYFERLIYDLKLENRVRLLGPRENVQPILWASDVFAMPSLYDPSSNAVLEALASGLPVLLTQSVGMAEEIQDAQAGFICHRNPDDLSSIITEALKEPVRQKMSTNARSFSLRFTESKVIPQWLDLYRRLSISNA